MTDRNVIGVIKQIEESIKNGDTDNEEFLFQVEFVCFILEEILKKDKKDH